MKNHLRLLLLAFWLQLLAQPSRASVSISGFPGLIQYVSVRASIFWFNDGQFCDFSMEDVGYFEVDEGQSLDFWDYSVDFGWPYSADIVFDCDVSYLWL